MIVITQHGRKYIKDVFFFGCKCGCIWHAKDEDGINRTGYDYYDDPTGTMNCPECGEEVSGTAPRPSYISWR